MSKLLKKQKVGYSLILLGAFMFAVGTLMPMATVVYTDFYFTSAWPKNSFNPDQPCALAPGQTYMITIRVFDGLGQPTSVSIDITTESGTESLVIPFSRKAINDYVFELEDAWTSPASGSVTFINKAVDSTGGKSISITTYGEVSNVEGYFSINGQQVGEESVIYVEDATVVFGFTATIHGESVLMVYIEVTNPDGSENTVELSEVTTDTYWEESYTLPGYGSYEVQGFVVAPSGTFQGMSIVVPFGAGYEPSPPEQVSFAPLRILGGILVIAGVVVSVWKPRKLP